MSQLENPPPGNPDVPSPGEPEESGLFGHLGEPLELVEHAIREQLASKAEVVQAMGDHVFGAGGKRLRPALLLLAAELCGYTGPRRIPLGAAIELLHTATLLHDDVVDLSNLRRGRPSANAIWGNRRAVLSGDFLYARASAMIVEDGNPDILFSFADTIRQMAEGELLQLQSSFSSTVTEARYYEVIERKSASLLATACEVGAVLGGVTRSERRDVKEFGSQLGIAFQLRDDALDYGSREDALGKRRYADLCEGKVTMPLLLTLKRCTVSEHEEISHAIKSAAQLADDPQGPSLSEAECEAVMALVVRYRGVEDTVRRARVHLERALNSIEAFPDGAARRALHEAAVFAVERDR